MRFKQFKLFQCCVPVKGIKNGIIVDFQRKIIHKVSNEIIDIIQEYSEKSIYNLFADYKASKLILKSYIRYFMDNELIIFSDNIVRYPSLRNDFFSPVTLESVCIEIVNITIYIEDFFKNEVNKLGLNSVIIILKNNDTENFIKILSILEMSKIKTIILYLEYSNGILLKLEPHVIDNPRILNIVFYNFHGKAEKSGFNEKFSFERLPINEILYGNRIESPNDFVLDIDLYHEALQYNLMFNKTLFIDSFGNIKKHRDDSNSYGNIQYNQINEIIKNEDFKLFWNISKDQIEVCKDCKFRYICPDVRIPYKSNLKELNYKLNTICNYDPYQDKWES